nr:hypothetical protein [uncultured Flavobacterium sp.]
MATYNTTLMLLSLKYAKEVLAKHGEKQQDGTYIFDNRKYTISNNTISSEPIL